MPQLILSPPRLAFIVATRAVLAAGVGLLVSSRLSDDKRRALGRTLVVVGVLTTIPAAMFLRQASRPRSLR